jgi:hypothetical protein
MKKLVFLVSIFFALAFTNKDASFKSTTVVITSESSVVVNGTTNVNSFKCNYNIDKFKNPIPIFYHLENDKMVFNKTVLVLDSNSFDCGGNAINKDFKKILKADAYPQISLFLKQIINGDNKNTVNALVDLEIAGVKKPFKIPVVIDSDNHISVKGKINISLKDFNIEAPKKFLGLVIVNNNIDIDFKLVVKEQ